MILIASALFELKIIETKNKLTIILRNRKFKLTLFTIFKNYDIKIQFVWIYL